MQKSITAKNLLFLVLLILLPSIGKAQKAKLVVQTGHSSWINSIAFSPDGKTVLSGSGDKTIKLWDAETGLELFTMIEGSDNITSIAFSPDGKTIASGGWSNTIKFWDAQTGSEVSKISGQIAVVQSIVFSPNGKILASAGYRREITLWDTETGKELKTLAKHNDVINAIAFSPDGKTIASVSSDTTIKLWDIQTGYELQSFIGHSDSVNSVTFSPDGKIIASGGDDNIVKIWNVKNGEEILTLTGHTFFVKTVVFSPDGKMLASGSWDSTIKIWNTHTGQLLRTFFAVPGVINSIAFSPDGKKLAYGSLQFTIELLNLESGNTIYKVKRRTDAIQSVAFSSDGKTIASGGWKTIKLWNMASGKILNTLSGHTGAIKSLAFSPDGKIVASGSWDNTVRIWDTASGQELNFLEGHTDYVNRVAFSQDGKTLASSSFDGTIKLWNVDTGDVKQNLQKSDQQSINQVLSVVPDFYKQKYDTAISKDGRLEIKIGENGKLNLVKSVTGKLLVSLIALDENDWAIVDPAGRFDASPDAEKLLHFVVGLEPVDLGQIKDRYYTPNLLQRIFKGENLDQTRPVTIFTADELYPLAEYEPLKAGETALILKLKNRGGGIGRVQVFVNGAEFLADARPKGLDPKAETAELKIDFSGAPTLKKGEQNEIEIVARNEAGWLRSRGSKAVMTDTRQKDESPQEFYAIIGGVSDYENPSFNLNFSAKDARDFAKATELGALKLFGKDKVHIRLLSSGTAEENAVLKGADSKHLAPSKENFRLVFEEFKKAKPTDVFVIYLSGHGTSINKGGDTGDTYLYLTKEAVTTDKSTLLDEKLRMTTTISSEELADWIREVPALKRAMILDTCAAGAVEASLIKPRELSPDQIKALDRMKDRTGFYVLMGSAADKQSFEATRYGQGLLTYSLLQAMSGARLRDGEYADVSLLFNYAEDAVVEMAKGIGGIQQPRIIAPTESRSFDIGRFSTEEKANFTLEKVKPLILQPQLSNDKLKFDNLKLSQMVAKALRDESSTLSRGGAEAKLVYVEAEEMKDAVTPGGVYEVIGDQIKVTLILVVNNEPVKTLTVEGSAEDKETLTKKIVRAIIENAPN